MTMKLMVGQFFENVAAQCRAKLMETIMYDRVELEQQNYSISFLNNVIHI